LSNQSNIFKKLIPKHEEVVKASMNGYYSTKLAAENLRKCYDIAPPRTKQYLLAEIQYVLEQLTPNAVVLELGCGYGRVLSHLVSYRTTVIGIDTSFESLRMAYSYLPSKSSLELLGMNAINLGFVDSCFDLVLCIQNGISAFKVNPKELMLEAYRVTKPGGICLFSSYSSKFWESRLEWFRLQAEEGLLGEIDWDLTKDGVIICKDGFRAATFDAKAFTDILEQLNFEGDIIEVDESSLFCMIRK